MSSSQNRLRWFDRRFGFAFEAETYPSILERLEGLVPRLRWKLERMEGVDLRARISGEWSIQENIGHLFDLEPLWAGRVDDFFAGAPVLRPADLENTKTHAADHNASEVETLVSNLAEARGSLLARLDAFAPTDFGRTAKHPRLDQPMRLVDLLYFVAEHDDTHLARITEIAKGSS